MRNRWAQIRSAGGVHSLARSIVIALTRRCTKRQCLRVLLVLVCFLAIFDQHRADALDPSRRISSTDTPPGVCRMDFSTALRTLLRKQQTDTSGSGRFGVTSRFDGVRFVPWNGQKGQELPPGSINSVLGSRDGSLWDWRSRATFTWRNGTLSNYPIAGRLNKMLEDPLGGVWLVRTRVGADKTGPLCHFADSRFHCYGPSDGITFPAADSLTRDHQENSGLEVREHSPAKTGFVQHHKSRAIEISRFTQRRRSSCFGSEQHTVRRNELFGAATGLTTLAEWAINPRFLTSPRWHYPTGFGIVLRQQWHALGWDREPGHLSNLKGKVDHFRASDGLSSDAVAAFYEDREGSLWIVTSRGLDCLRNVKVATFSTRQGLSSDEAGSVVATRDAECGLGTAMH